MDNIYNMVSVAIYTNTSSTLGRNLFGTLILNNVIDVNAITTEQLASLKQVHNYYTIFLEGKQYQRISSNYVNYINLLNAVNSINVADPKLQILIQIAKDGLIGSLNSVSIYNQFAFKEIALIELNNQIVEILSKKNRQQALNSATSTMHGVQCLKLSPLFSYYIKLYGFPKFGVGFDPVKLAFLQNIAMK
jgi:hypothetical protein